MALSDYYYNPVYINIPFCFIKRTTVKISERTMGYNRLHDAKRNKLDHFAMQFLKIHSTLLQKRTGNLQPNVNLCNIFRQGFLSRDSLYFAIELTA